MIRRLDEWRLDERRLDEWRLDEWRLDEWRFVRRLIVFSNHLYYIFKIIKLDRFPMFSTIYLINVSKFRQIFLKV